MATMTAAQRREQERAAYNAYVAECPSRQVLDALSDKWVTLVLTALADAPAALQRARHARSLASARRCSPRRCACSSATGSSPAPSPPSVPVRVDYQLTAARPDAPAGRPRDQGLVRNAHRRGAGRPRRLRPVHPTLPGLMPVPDARLARPFTVFVAHGGGR